MAYPVPPTAPRIRPTVVAVAAVLLGLTAVDQLISSGVTVAMISKMVDAYRTAYQGSDVDPETVATGVQVGLYAQVAIGALIAVGIGVLALLDAAGKQPARIVTWVLGGLYLCCGTATLSGGLLSSSLMTNNTGSSGGPSAADVQNTVSDALPTWYQPATLALSGIGLVAMLAAVILLALPAANAYFRKPAAQQWEPPVPPAGIPGYPGQ